MIFHAAHCECVLNQDDDEVLVPDPRCEEITRRRHKEILESWRKGEGKSGTNSFGDEPDK